MTGKHAQAMKFLEHVAEDKYFPDGSMWVKNKYLSTMAKVIREQMAAMKGVMGYCRRVGLDEGSIFDSVHGVLEQALANATAQLAALEQEGT